MQDRDQGDSREDLPPPQKNQLVNEQLDAVQRSRLEADLGPSGAPRVRLNLPPRGKEPRLTSE